MATYHISRHNHVSYKNLLEIDSNRKMSSFFNYADKNNFFFSKTRLLTFKEISFGEIPTIPENW